MKSVLGQIQLFSNSKEVNGIAVQMNLVGPVLQIKKIELNSAQGTCTEVRLHI